MMRSGFASLHALLEYREHILNVGDLAVYDENVRVVEHGFHAVGVGDHVGAEVAFVELEAFDGLKRRTEALAVLNGDDAFLTDLLHSLGEELADFLVVGGDGSYLSDLLVLLDGHGLFLEFFDYDFSRKLHPLAELHTVRAGGYVLRALADHRAGEDGRGRGSVSGDVVGLGGDFFDELSAHILERIFEFDFLSDGHAVVGDGRRAEFLFEYDVAALRSKGDSDGVGYFIDTTLHSAASFFFEKQNLCHNNLFLQFLTSLR